MLKKKGKKKPKLDAYFSGLNVLDNDEDESETVVIKKSHLSKASAMRMEESCNSDEKNHFYGKLRRFLHGKSEGELLPITPEKPSLVEYKYIQMKLAWTKITPKYIANLEKYRKANLTSRIATDNDIPILVKLYNRAFMMTTDPWSPLTEAQFKEILHFGKTIILIATYMGLDVGFIILDFEGSGCEIGIICGLVVDPSYQKRGFSKYLSLISIEYFRSKNVKELHCEVFEENKPSYHMIKSLEFEEFGIKSYAY